MRRRCRGVRSSGYTLCNLVRDIYRAGRQKMSVTVNRDRIYALLGLVTDGNNLAISPDYCVGTTTDTIYTHASCPIIESSLDGIQILGLIQSPKNIPREMDAAARLPS